jgi:hypothetical protein
MILAMVMSVLVGGFIHGQVSFEDCKKINFENKACVTSKAMHEAGKALESVK